MEDIKYILRNDEIELHLPNKNQGKFRWKQRKDNSFFGMSFPTATERFTNDAYLEWQIGYDMETNHKTKKTILNHLEFMGSNKKKKNPYELSEILYLMLDMSLVSKKTINDLYIEITERNFFLDEEHKIKVKDPKTVKLSDFLFHRQDIVLPTFSNYKDEKGLSIEISIQKQQYGTGVQPMVYFTIPLPCFDNYQEMLGKTSKEFSNAIFIVNKNNSDVFLNMFRFFGICSFKHKMDVLSILSLLLN